MYCRKCGQLLDLDQQVCSRCANPVVAVPVAAAVAPALPHAQQFRVHKNLQTVGILWIVFAGWSLMHVLATAAVLTGMTGIFGNRFGMNPGFLWDHFPFFNAPWLVPLITTVAIGRTILSAATGLALLRRAPWARTLGLVAAFLTLLRPILGTLLAIYTLWVLIPAASRREYEAISVP